MNVLNVTFLTLFIKKVRAIFAFPLGITIAGKAKKIVMKIKLLLHKSS